MPTTILAIAGKPWFCDSGPSASPLQMSFQRTDSWGNSSEYGVRVGVWLMPDNRRIGALEDFLKDLIDDSDPLLRHAEKSTAEAKARGARFPEKYSKKALVHSWLAWQEEPGPTIRCGDQGTLPSR